MPSQVFISHSNADGPMVEAVARLITAVGVTPYLAEHDPQPGAILVEKLEAAITASDAEVLLLTKNSAASHIVQHEVAFARGRDRLVIPLVHPSVVGDVDGLLTGIEYIEYDFEADPSGPVDLVPRIRQLAEAAAARDSALAQQQAEAAARQRSMELLEAAAIGILVGALLVLVVQGRGAGLVPA